MDDGNGYLPIYLLTWFMPAFVKSSVGSSWGTTEELGTNVRFELTQRVRKSIQGAVGGAQER